MASDTPKRKEIKRRFQLWIKPSVLQEAEELLEDDNCKSVSEFIEKAVQFYAGFVRTKNSKDYLSNVIISSVNGAIAQSDERHNRMMFKMAVELAMMMNIIAASQDISPIELERLRGACVKEVSRLNGRFSFQDAIDWQKGD